jgi:CheY-like chemotaxis protein
VGSILLVATDPEARDRMGLALRDGGHEVLDAFTLHDGLLRVSEGGIDAVVIDSYDPRGGVVQLAREMSALPDAPPVVLVSSSPHAPEISARIGAVAFLPKPYEPGELASVIGRVAGRVRPVRQFDDEPTGPRIG